jgi:hypothetical protein
MKKFIKRKSIIITLVGVLFLCLLAWQMMGGSKDNAINSVEYEKEFWNKVHIE